jgi:hypothetical protein
MHRSFEWFWADDGSMPGFDAFESLRPREQNDFEGSLDHWGNVEPGQRPAQSRVNAEHEKPLVLAMKAGKHRFTAFREPRGHTWIVFGHYLKEGEKRDKTGDRVVARTLLARHNYFKRVNNGTYYDRG